MNGAQRMLALAGLALIAVTGPASAQSNSHGQGHAGASHAQSTQHGVGHGSAEVAIHIKGTANEASRAFAEANARMHTGMNITYSGDADVDFVKGMIAHHQGAVEMAGIVLEHGKDSEIRKLANEIIEAQAREIAMMQDWLKRKGK
jgi:uncharacterized protein (DUF305 family)